MRRRSRGHVRRSLEHGRLPWTLQVILNGLTVLWSSCSAAHGEKDYTRQPALGECVPSKCWRGGHVWGHLGCSIERGRLPWVGEVNLGHPGDTCSARVGIACQCALSTSAGQPERVLQQ